jgi:hypothetical protein
VLARRGCTCGSTAGGYPWVKKEPLQIEREREQREYVWREHRESTHAHTHTERERERKKESQYRWNILSGNITIMMKADWKILYTIYIYI